ncbi:hypothetical protein OPV22_026213 [Ensete ventricosum]|uniref:Trichome birefringence-like C-terminal domain-containing protein n=1 Tax=Ensete ventricosum TaxID=4639 RepID=A0AAV8P8U3_ENSVE|nr:hypothetical protein OPV22_026213 [Ensete ventricosum]
MKEAAKPPQSSAVVSDLKALFCPFGTRRTKVFLYGSAFAFVAFSAYLAFCPPEKTSPWFDSLFSSANVSTAPYRSQISSLVSHIFPNSSPPPSPDNMPADGGGAPKGGILWGNATTAAGGVAGSNKTADGVGVKNLTASESGLPRSGVTEKNRTASGSGLQGGGYSMKNQTTKGGNGISTSGQGKDGVGPAKATTLTTKNRTTSGIGPPKSGDSPSKNQTTAEDGSKKDAILAAKNLTVTGAPPLRNNETETGVGSLKNGHLPVKNQRGKGVAASKANPVPPNSKESAANAPKNGAAANNQSSSGLPSVTKSTGATPKKDKEGASGLSDSLVKRNGYSGGDGRKQKLRWQPDGCNIPRLNATDMLERLRGKRVVFVGDSLNRNMWESLVCILRDSIKDKRKVFEASGRHEFRTEGSYSFVFEDFNCSVEFFRSPFLVQEWETPGSDGNKKETLRLDMIERSSAKYKDSDVIVFNTGHWWTHEKTSKGKDYYQEGSHIYSDLNVVNAFRKALNTWANWVDANVNSKSSLVFFRGYSVTHFSGGRWNSGGQCDKETEPIENENYLSSYPWKMTVLESVIKGMRTPVAYLNITRMTDYRKDAHPSIYRKQNLTEEERRSPERYQDCSHWCLPGVPDSWNELLYAQLLINQHQLL